jgi:predicted dehydrogenase
MSPKKPARVLFLAGDEGETWKALRDYLQATSSIQVEFQSSYRLPGDLEDFQVLVHSNPARLSSIEQERLILYVQRGGGCLAFTGPNEEPLPLLFGVQTGPATPWMSLRLKFPDPGHFVARRLPSEVYLNGRFQPLEARSGNFQPILVTTWHYQQASLALMGEEKGGRICCTTLRAGEDPFFQQFIYRVIRHLAGWVEPPPLGVAILGYGPLGSVGSLHGLALREVSGLNLLAICDYNPERLLKCQEDFPACRTYATSRDLGDDPEVNLVIIATPPNTHASLAIELLQNGKHVVCEKPMCLTRQEAELMIETADQSKRVLSCFQNRRWDADYLAIRQALEAGWIGEPFYLETFVGDFRHPCHFWHSHRPISGDALYDWGAHYVDWILNLFPGPTAYVSGIRHKRVWHDVTNADQVRALIRFTGGQEAEFLYSDIAALRKPKWYLLGTEGAILGEWTEISLRELDPVTYYREEQIPSTESAPRLTLRRRNSSGSMGVQQLPLPTPRLFSYYYNLADHVLTGEPLAVTAQSAARVVAVLEVATRSAEKGGTQEALHV